MVCVTGDGEGVSRAGNRECAVRMSVSVGTDLILMKTSILTPPMSASADSRASTLADLADLPSLDPALAFAGPSLCDFAGHAMQRDSRTNTAGTAINTCGWWWGGGVG